MTGAPAVPVEAGLLERFRTAGGQIAWRNVPKAPKGRRVRVAHLNDEEARVEEWTEQRSTHLVADSGPVGALVIVLEVDRRGPPSRLTTHAAGELAPYAQGAIEAVWGGRSKAGSTVPLTDLVGLARYALA